MAGSGHPPASAACPETSSRFRKRSTAKRVRPTCRGLPACRLYRRCRHGAAGGVEAVSRLPTSCRNCRTHDAGMSAGNAGTTAVDFRAGAGGCPGASRAPGGVLPAGHGWPAAGRGSWTRTPAGGAHPPVRATGSATPNEAPHRHPALRRRAKAAAWRRARTPPGARDGQRDANRRTEPAPGTEHTALRPCATTAAWRRAKTTPPCARWPAPRPTGPRAHGYLGPTTPSWS